MVRTGRPKKAIQTIKRTFKITPELDEKINEVLEYHGIEHGLEDRSFIVRVALENYLVDFYE
jgi:hypothetical protein